MMNKFWLYIKLAFNQWYLTQIVFNPMNHRGDYDWQRAIKRQRKLVKLLEARVNEPLDDLIV